MEQHVHKVVIDMWGRHWKGIIIYIAAVGNCDIHVEQKILFMNETKRYSNKQNLMIFNENWQKLKKITWY